MPGNAYVNSSSQVRRLRSVHIDMTVVWADREQDLRVTAPDDAALSLVFAALADAVGAPHDASLWLGTDLLSPDTSLADRRLRTGIRLQFGGAGRTADASPVLALHVAGGPAAGRVVPLGRGRFRIGRAADNDLVLDDPDVSRRHATLAVTGTGITVRDAGSANGTLLGGRAASPDGAPVRAGDIVRLGSSLLTIAGPVGPPASIRTGPNGSSLLDRAPRTREAATERVIARPRATPPPRPPGLRWVAALLPAAAGAAIALSFGQPEFLLIALLSPAMLISSSLADRLNWRRAKRLTTAALRRRHAEVDREVADELVAEAARRRHAAPDPADLLRAATLPDTRVWARQRGDPDLLDVRLGFADLPSALALRDDGVVMPAGTLADVPLLVDLRRGPIGVAGPTARGSGRWLIAQLATHLAPGDLEFALFVDADCDALWRWTRWLPQLRGKVAVTTAQCGRLVERISAVVEQRVAARRSVDDRWAGPWLVVLVDRPTPTGLAGLVETLARGSQVGVTGVWLAPTASALPACCVSVARVDGPTGSRLAVRGPTGPERVAIADQVSSQWADDVARSLAPLVDGGAAGDARVPDSCRLLDVLEMGHPGAAAVHERWDRSGGGARSVIGLGAAGPVEVDLATDGPHLLVAGTTGAGKSELLRTLVASLAVAHSPEEVNLLLIDYKGGAAFAECAPLPHVAGLLTDLDPYLTGRALRSLRAELRRRERLFAAVGAEDLTAYRRREPRRPVPRLVIVVDEFATLAEDLPDFVPGLVNVARLGRSLGLHLILATQRPGGVVSPEIRANTDLRIALRVADPSESQDVIASPVAATVDRAVPGRGYLRAGAALTCFQTGYVSGPAAPDARTARVEWLDEWRRASQASGCSDDSDLARLVAAVRATARERGSAPARSPWRPPLPALLTRADLDPPAHSAAVALGRIDLPDEQRQDCFDVDLRSSGSLLVAGAARSGRTSALVSLAIGAGMSFSPVDLHLQVIDAGGDLAGAIRLLPHCASVLGPAEVDLAPTLLTRLARAAAERLTPPGRAVDPSHIVLVLIDGWDLACAALSDAAAAVGTDALLSLLRLAPSAGYAVAVTGDRALLAPRFAGGFGERLLLRLSDGQDAGAVGVPAQDVARGLPPGRAVRATDGTLVQLALPAESAEAVRTDVAAAALRWRAAVPGPSPVRVRPLPQCVRLEELPAAPGRLALGLAGDDPAPVVADPFAGPARWLVAGPPRSGRSTLLRSLAEQAHAAGIATLVAATERSALLPAARARGIPTLGPGSVAGPVPGRPTLVLVDDAETFADTAVGACLIEWARDHVLPVALVVAGRTDELATSYRGVAAEVRRHRFGVLLRPGPLDGELFGIRLPRQVGAGPPGRGVALADSSWGAAFADGLPVPIQVATP